MTLLLEIPSCQNNLLTLFENFIPTDKFKSSQFEQVVKFLVCGIEPFVSEFFVHAQDFLE